MTSEAQQHASYKDAGVDLDAAEEVVSRIAKVVASKEPSSTVRVLEGIGPFAGAIDASFLCGEGGWQASEPAEVPVLVSGCDGVGTKVLLAAELGMLEHIGIDLVAMCADDVVCLGARPVFFLDYLSFEKLDPQVVEVIVGGIVEGCRRAGCVLLGGETAEHPAHGNAKNGSANSPGLDMAGFCVGHAWASELLGPSRVRPGDLLVGLESTNLRSNGFSLVRALFAAERLALPAWAGESRSLGEVLLEPSIIYTPGILAAMAAADPGGLHAVCHVTGGGIPSNLARILPRDTKAVLQADAWPIPRVFQEIQEAGKIGASEMVSVFNLGLGMVLSCAPRVLDAVRGALGARGYQSHVVGKVVPSSGSPEVVIEGLT
jgi:phosphoribosylformylglycinamidine cyclo-ligase